MHENSETSINSAKAAVEHYQKKANDTKKSDAAINKDHQLAADQVALLKESNELAMKANIEAKKASADSKKSSKTAFLSNIIAVASLIVAIVSLVLTV